MSIVDDRTLLGWCGDATAWAEISASYSAVKPTYLRANVTAKGEFTWGGEGGVLDLENLPATLVEIRRDTVDAARMDKLSVFLTDAEGEKLRFAFTFDQGTLSNWPENRWLSATGAWSESMCE